MPMTDEERKELIAHKAKMAKVPPRFKAASFDTFKASTNDQKEVKQRCMGIVENFPQILDKGVGGAIFYGTVGTGKTHMAISIIRELIRRYLANCRYAMVSDVIRDVRETWNRSDLHEEQVIDRYASYHMLVIDEIGVQYGTDSERTILFEVINKRSMNMMPTILISNLDEDGLKVCVGDRIVDRIYESGGGSVAFAWKSHRRK